MQENLRYINFFMIEANLCFYYKVDVFFLGMVSHMHIKILFDISYTLEKLKHMRLSQDTCFYIMLIYSI